LCFKKYVLFFMLLPFLSILPAYYVHGQTVSQSIRMLLPQLYWLFYFVLHRIQISEKAIFKTIIFIGFTWVLLQIVQQITFPYYYFYTRGGAGGDWIEIRSGIYRYMITGITFGVLVLFYYLSSVLRPRFRKTDTLAIAECIEDSSRHFYWLRLFVFPTIDCRKTNIQSTG